MFNSDTTVVSLGEDQRATIYMLLPKLRRMFWQEQELDYGCHDVVCSSENQGNRKHLYVFFLRPIMDKVMEIQCIAQVGDIFISSQVYAIIELARRKNPYKVIPMGWSDFLDFKSLSKLLRILTVRTSNEEDSNKTQSQSGPKCWKFHRSVSSPTRTNNNAGTTRDGIDEIFENVYSNRPSSLKEAKEIISDKAAGKYCP
ncbi:unnamed protein product [Acanthoscelides obtectus]|uniref:Uncharacterized protein n=1 Tax=Acanthoscelides obtectus TaxID=200917 RepID=A0A9P0M7B1_ACAOB|nr:unnamed protein product [Acanthoscelides obtectus]CAK1642171.1 hypothetical protein AOBTE_LOCUS12861 [Acanthoscelides obtectus]